MKVELREEETLALGKVSLPLIFGFAVHWAWLYLIVSGCVFLDLGVSPAVHRVGFIVSIAVLSATLFCYAAFLTQARKIFGNKGVRNTIRFCGALLMCIGSLIFMVGGASSIWGTASAIAFGLLTGVGGAVLLMSFGVSFSVCDAPTAAFSVGCALMICPFLFLGVVGIADASILAGAIVLLALPFADYLCLGASSRQIVDGLSFNSITMAVRPFPFFLHVFFPGLVFGFVLGVLRSVVLFDASLFGDFGAYAQAFILAGIVTAVLVVGAIVTQRQINNFMFRTLLPIAAILIASLYFIGGSVPFYAAFSLMTSCLLLETCLWVFFADVSQRFRISAFTVFGFGGASCFLGSIGGMAVYPWMLVSAGTSTASFDFGAIMAVGFVSFVLGYSFLPKNVELRNTLKLRASCTGLWDNSDAFYPGPTSHEDPNTASVPTPSQSQPRAKEREEEASPATAAGEGGDHAANAAVAPTNAAVAPTGEGSRLEVLDSMEDHLNEEERRHNQRVGRFKRKCAKVAETYLLSRKETEVLFLLAKGKNSAAIQEQLYISAGTANTHMRRIYRKLDVHSQQELMKLVEDTEVEDWDELS